MSKDRFLLKLRSQHWYGLVVRALAEVNATDFEFVAPRGKGHPKLIVRMGERVLRTPVPSTERGSGDHKYLVNRIKKFARSQEPAA